MKIEVVKNNKILVNSSKENFEIHPLWLRERANNNNLVDQLTEQRIYDPSTLDKSIKIKKANLKADSLNIFNLFNNPTYASIGAIAAMFLVIVTTFVLRPSNLNSNQMIIDSSTNSYIEEEFVEGDSIDYEEVEGEAQDREQESKNHNKILRVDDSTDN